MTAAELERAEDFFGFRFPGEFRDFLMLVVPVGEEFFDYRDCSEENLERFRAFYRWMERRFRFDLEHCRDILEKMLGFAEEDAVLEYWRKSVRLIPFYAHRCFFDGLDDMPIVSFLQPVDTIIYGNDLKSYLRAEFLKDYDDTEISEERLEGTGIWKDLIFCEDW